MKNLFLGMLVAIFSLALGSVDRFFNFTPKDNLYEDSLRAAKLENFVKVKKIENFFKDRDMPLFENAETFVEVAEKYDLPYNFLPAIATVESSGGKRDKNNNPFGWGSAKIRFSHYDEAIEVVGQKLATHKFYRNKTISQKLLVYNQEDKNYRKKIYLVMNKIEKEKI